MINVDITQKFDSINDMSGQIYLNRDLIKILSSLHPSDTSGIISEMSILDKLLANYAVTDSVDTLLIPKIYVFNRPEYQLYSFTDRVCDLSLIEKERWYKALPSKAEFTVVGFDKVSFASSKVETIKIARRLFGLDNMNLQLSGVLTIDIAIEYFNTILDKSKPTIDSQTFILDGNKTVIISSDKSIIGKNMGEQSYISDIAQSKSIKFESFIENINHVKSLVAYEKIKPLNLTIVALTPVSELNGELIWFNKIIYIIIALCSLVALSMALVLSNYISYPIRKLVNSMKVVQTNNFDINLEYKRNDEFSYLIATYKKMVREIKELIDKLYVSEVRKKEAELKSLQSQINPHFLYNTLDSVNWMALSLNATDIGTMVTSLSNFFRYSLSKGKNIIPLGDELKQVDSYLKIQKIRFKNKLEYTIDCPNDLQGYLTVKLILQPIVENSIIHGINKISESGVITLTVRKLESIIEIKICDNGIGADVEELNAILTGNSSRASFGIRNVNDRIKHYFGDEYGITFMDNEGPGITAIIGFPASKRMEDLKC